MFMVAAGANGILVGIFLKGFLTRSATIPPMKINVHCPCCCAVQINFDVWPLISTVITTNSETHNLPGYCSREMLLTCTSTVIRRKYSRRYDQAPVITLSTISHQPSAINHTKTSCSHNQPHHYTLRVHINTWVELPANYGKRSTIKFAIATPFA
jgi:hypothetical protein